MDRRKIFGVKWSLIIYNLKIVARGEIGQKSSLFILERFFFFQEKCKENTNTNLRIGFSVFYALFLVTM